MKLKIILLLAAGLLLWGCESVDEGESEPELYEDSGNKLPWDKPAGWEYVPPGGDLIGVPRQY